MKYVFVVVAMICLAAGCAAPVQQENEVAVTADALTLAECAEQRDACFRNNPFFGLFTCPIQYTQCVATAENGIPAQVTAAITDARACAREGAACTLAAETPADLLQCTREEAECVAAIVDVQLPQIVTGTAQCVEGAVSCIAAAESVGELAACGETLEDCALEEVVATLPEGVGAVVEDVGECNIALAYCTDVAATPAALTACSEDYIVCIGAGLGVPLPNPPVSEALYCAEDAAACTFEARSLAALGACGDAFAECNAGIVEQQLSCEQTWTQCLAQNPFAFLQCTAALLTCQD